MWTVISAAVRIGCNRIRQIEITGEVTEWLKVHDWKSCGGLKPPRGFESLPLRHNSSLFMKPRRRTIPKNPGQNCESAEKNQPN